MYILVRTKGEELKVFALTNGVHKNAGMFESDIGDPLCGCAGISDKSLKLF